MRNPDITFDQKMFRFFFAFSMVVTLLGMHYVFNFVNTNPFERGLLIIAAFFLFKAQPKASIQGFFGLILITFAIFFFGYFTKFHQFSWGRLLNAYIALIALLLFYVIQPSEDNRIFILKWISRIAPFLVFYGFFLMLFGRSVFMQDHTGAMRYGGGTIPAYMAAASFASSVAFAMLYRHTGNLKNFAMVFFCLVCAILSGSRMPTVCILLSAFPILFFSIKKFESKVYFVLFSLIFGVLALVTVGDQLMMRFESQSSSGRDKLWDSVIMWIKFYPNTGVGYGHHPLIIPEYIKLFTKTQAVHSEYIRVVGELGYFGAAIFLIGIILVFNGSFIKKNFEDVVLVLCILTSFALFSYSDNTLLSSYCSIMPLAYAMGTGLKKANSNV
jgi:hypothetical protein